MKKIVLISIVLGFIYAVTASDARAQEVCKDFLGRPKEKVCQTKPLYDACLVSLKQGTVDACTMSGDANSWVRRTTPAEAVATLIQNGCKKSIFGNIYTCEKPPGPGLCASYKNFFDLMQTPKPPPVAGCVLVPTKTDDGNLYVYAVGLDDALLTIKKSKGTWGASNKLDDSSFGGPDACSPNPGKIIVAYPGAGYRLTVKSFDYSNTISSRSAFGKIGSDPTVLCQSGDKVTLFVRGFNNTQLYWSYAENGVWPIKKVPDFLPIEDVAGKSCDKLCENGLLAYPFGPFGGAMKGSPDGVAFGGDNRAVFVRGTDDHIWWRVTFDNKTWAPWEQFSPLGGIKVTSDPAAVSRKPGEILLFARGENNMLWVTQYSNGKWTGWVPWGGVMAGSPDATSWGGNRVDVFYRGADGSLYHVWRDDTEALIKEPKIEKVPGMTIKNDPTAVGVKW